MLMIALSLSVLNAIMGSARALHQMSIDGEFPRIFSNVNRHGVPGFSMGFNVVCSIALIFTGGAVEIYSLSNVGYLASFIPVLVGYYLLRKYRPDMRRPVRMPEFFKYIALAMAAGYFVIWMLRRARLHEPPQRAPGRCGHPHLLLHRLGDPALLPAPVLVPGQGRGSQAREGRPAGGASDGSRRLIAGSRVGAVFRRASPPPDPATLRIERLVVATEGRPIAWSVLQQAFELARPAGARVLVVSIARVWGTSLGFPNPGLNPTRHEWDAQRLLVREARDAIEKAGFEASGHVIGTRRAAKRILAEATRFDADAIVMGADRHRGMLADFLWSQEPYRVARRARVPVYLVRLDEG